MDVTKFKLAVNYSILIIASILFTPIVYSKILKLIPNIIIMAPKNFRELEDMLELAVSLNKPVMIRYPRGGESKTKLKNSKLKLGKAEILKEGEDITIIGIGSSVSKAIEVSEMLNKDDISAEVVNVRFLKPIDSNRIVKSIRKTGKVIVIEDGTIIGGLSSSIKEILLENRLNVESKYYAYPDKFIRHGSVQQIEEKYKVDTNSIYNDIINILKK